jgi:hypothetical protein
MKLDLTMPAHREALARAACFHVRWPYVAKRIVSDLPADLLDLPEPLRVAGAAHRTLSTPSLAADALCGLLVWMGLNAHVEQWPMRTGGDYVVMWNDDAHDNRGSHVEITRAEDGELQRLFRRLLAIPEDAPNRRELALTVLR